MTDRAAKLLWLYHEQSKKNRTIRGSPPLTFKGKGKDLKNYRIYGNTVNGESVGDRTGNLFNGNIISAYTEIGSQHRFTVNNDATAIILETTLLSSTVTINAVNANRCYVSYYNTYPSNGDVAELFVNVSLSLPQTITVNTSYKYIMIQVGYQVAVSNIMLNSGSEPLPYEPYGYRMRVTVTDGTNTTKYRIYLPEQIKMVGDEAEYVDFEEQKQHRVRKNLLQTTATSQTINGVTFTVNDDGSVTCNGTNNKNEGLLFEMNLPGTVLPEGKYITSGCPAGGTQSGGYKIQYYNGSSWGYELGDGSAFTLSGNLTYRSRILISSNYTCNNLTFYPMLRKADISDDTYEPYIEDTELDVTLLALPTLSGTNTLSVGTEVQPSGVEIKGRIKAVQEGGA